MIGIDFNEQMDTLQDGADQVYWDLAHLMSELDSMQPNDPRLLACNTSTHIHFIAEKTIVGKPSTELQIKELIQYLNLG